MDGELDGAGQQDAVHQAALALSVVVDVCPDVTADPRDAAALLQVSTAWRQVMRDARTHSVDMSRIDLRSPGRLRGFAAWLKQHSGLLGAAKVDTYLWPCSAGESVTARLMLGALQAAAVRGGLHLHALSSNILHTAPVLGALPNATLTFRELGQALGGTMAGSSRTDKKAAAAAAPVAAPGFSGALRGLSGLRELTLGAAACAVSSSTPGGAAVPPALLAALTSLQHLTRLTLRGAVVTAKVQAGLSPRLAVLTLDGGSFPNGLDLRHLTNLLDLDLAPRQAGGGAVGGSGGPPYGTQSVGNSSNGHHYGSGSVASPEAVRVQVAALLPHGLTALTLLSAQSDRERVDLTLLPRLRRLTTRESQESAEWLRTSAAPAAAAHLTHLSLTYAGWSRALTVVSGAGTWARVGAALQHIGLCGLVLRYQWQRELLLEALPLAAGLTSLHVLGLSCACPGSATDLELCAALAPLAPRLASLVLCDVGLAAGEATHLSRLTGLTQLIVDNCGRVAGDQAAAVAASGAMPRLAHLSVTGYGAPLNELLGALSSSRLRRTSLRSLQLCGHVSRRCSAGAHTDEASLALAGALGALTRLELPWPAEVVPGGALQRLRAALPGLGRDGLLLHPIV